MCPQQRAADPRHDTVMSTGNAGGEQCSVIGRVAGAPFAQARANGAPCEFPTTAGCPSPRSAQSCRISPAKSEKVRPGAGVEAPSPDRSTETRRTPSASTTPAPKPSHRLVAAPGHNRTGTPSNGPHSAQPSNRPSGRRLSPSRAGLSTYTVMIHIVAMDRTSRTRLSP